MASQEINLSSTEREKSLIEILHVRGMPLAERELWAVCRTCALELINMTNQCFKVGTKQLLLVTPASVMFSENGSVNVNPVDTNFDNISDYIAPELTIGALAGTIKASALVFSLAVTLFLAADFHLTEDEEPAISEDMELLLSTMTDEVAANRVDLQTVSDLAADGLIVCEDNHDVEISRSIVTDLFNSARSVISAKVCWKRVRWLQSIIDIMSSPNFKHAV